MSGKRTTRLTQTKHVCISTRSFFSCCFALALATAFYRFYFIPYSTIWSLSVFFSSATSTSTSAPASPPPPFCRLLFSPPRRRLSTTALTSGLFYLFFIFFYFIFFSFFRSFSCCSVAITAPRPQTPSNILQNPPTSPQSHRTPHPRYPSFTHASQDKRNREEKKDEREEYLPRTDSSIHPFVHFSHFIRSLVLFLYTSFLILGWGSYIARRHHHQPSLPPVPPSTQRHRIEATPPPRARHRLVRRKGPEIMVTVGLANYWSPCQARATSLSSPALVRASARSCGQSVADPSTNQLKEVSDEDVQRGNCSLSPPPSPLSLLSR